MTDLGISLGLGVLIGAVAAVGYGIYHWVMGHHPWE